MGEESSRLMAMGEGDGNWGGERGREMEKGARARDGAKGQRGPKSDGNNDYFCSCSQSIGRLEKYGYKGASMANVVLPGAAYTEKEGTYVNTEGRVQMTRPAVPVVGNSRDDWKIIRALSEVLGKRLPYDSVSGVRQRLAEVAPHLSRIDSIEPSVWLNGDALAHYHASALADTPFEKVVDNFYMTDPISRASQTMAKCTAARKKEVAEGRYDKRSCAVTCGDFGHRDDELLELMEETREALDGVWRLVDQVQIHQTTAVPGLNQDYKWDDQDLGTKGGQEGGRRIDIDDSPKGGIYGQRRMSHLLSRIGAALKDCLLKKCQQLSLWDVGNFRKVEMVLSHCLRVISRWENVTSELTKLTWPRFDAHIWEGKPFEDKLLTAFRNRIDEILKIREIHKL
ncbi:hypothetical protein CBR_g44347 [Chara braunii]|uniref:Molybdopterin oxidoreductase domain-containing protein n=1 Tax=Chara braunii TaxID=69332 RepID=A0A388K325_CHABU|nr:hypothetical protein CBR_g44347 [Chara braunii]|eukprot:GBG64462.1 hypothetical protein CBR_g44347 [Chara braunii]